MGQMEMADISKLQEEMGILNITEKSRLESFKSWPYDDKAACSIEKMAEAGFYWTGNEKENDTATCFVCKKVLDGWEATDDPWVEHKKHAPQCYFVKLGKPENKHTVDETSDLCFNLVTTSIQNRKEFYQKKIKIQAEKLREKFTTTF